jgi:type VI secretion system protein VasG
LPDKAIGVLDTACAKVALGQTAVPAAIEDNVKLLDRMAAEIGALEREAATGASHQAKLAELYARRAGVQRDLASLQGRFDAEKVLVTEILKLRDSLETALEKADAPQAVEPDVKPAVKAAVKATTKKTIKPSKASANALTPGQAALRAKQDELAALQGETPLIPMQVDGLVVAEIVAAWTGIPLGKMVKDEIKTVLNLKPLLSERVLGQPHALEAVAQRVRTARANLEDPNKPKGVFMFVGPSGVGKTETALALADVLYGGERKLITINMSEYQEAHSVSGLKGSPPGYVGYGEGGVLTEAVRRNPYSVVLLDEVEKAHPDVLELFFQVFDKGVLDDAEGREIDFRNTIIILTSNIGSQQIMQACLNKPADELPSVDQLSEALRPVLYKTFKPAFLGRMKVVPYYAITDAVLEQIIHLKLDRIAARVAVNHKASFDYDTKLVEAVLARCTEVDSGARNVDHILTGTLLPEIAENVLARMAEGRAIERIKVSAAKNGDFKYTVQ